MADERKGFLLRLPPQLLAEVRSWAEQDLRSLNAQIEWLLHEALRRRRSSSSRGAAEANATAHPPPAPPDVPRLPES